MEINLKCNNGSAKLVMPKAGNDVKSPYVPAKIVVDLTNSDLQQKIAIRCVAQPKVLGSDSKDALVMSHGNFIDVMMTNTTSKLKKLGINVKINSSIIK
ncbi:hypothetical protein [Acetilactobacillus jinshanensis]|uniref:Uncharacterized protein n=1 Tax=Acetilactobacillus jinshanensis TaxID=1720083 RepID=A0A4P6ZKV9_9LACO|nr:hypothetical protein [Acetilactobacillus jinshanensis]QBP18445.1 hypothetical protein ELX58_04690 [Acetilactobacillus jinshanensis]URL61317.1 hypothetical protein HGK75_04800 [uncultured bacterium]